MSKQVLILIVLVAMFVAADYGCDNSVVIGKKDNGFHYAGGLLWMEWWTLNIMAGSKVQGMINYIFAKALNIGGVAVVYPALVVPATNETFHTKDIYPLSAFSASKDSTNITIQSGAHVNKMYATDSEENHFVVSGGTKDGKSLWNLQVTRAAQNNPMCLTNHTSLGHLENFNWISYLPACSITGTVTLRGKTYDVQGYGESNHPWGELFEPILKWNWAQMYNGKLTFYMVTSDGKGMARVLINGTILYWSYGQFKLDQFFENQKYPVEQHVTGDNGKFKISAKWRVYAADAASLSDAAENPADYTVELCASGTSDCTQYIGKGWSEYGHGLF